MKKILLPILGLFAILGVALMTSCNSSNGLTSDHCGVVESNCK